jgi:hypothetical protein
LPDGRQVPKKIGPAWTERDPHLDDSASLAIRRSHAAIRFRSRYRECLIGAAAENLRRGVSIGLATTTGLRPAFASGDRRPVADAITLGIRADGSARED